MSNVLSFQEDKGFMSTTVMLGNTSRSKTLQAPAADSGYRDAVEVK